VAELLGTTTASVNSALQRARATLAARGVSGEAPAGDPETGRVPSPDAEAEALDGPERELLARYVDAFGRFDVESLVALVQADDSGTAPARLPRAAERPHPGAATATRHPVTVDPGRYRYCA
jgi:RNA polymerase sigma-70 factor (ECF subfamily)